MDSTTTMNSANRSSTRRRDDRARGAFAATELDTAGLRAVAALPDAVLHRYDWTTAGYESTIFEIASVDLSPLKRLARRELVRRGNRSAFQETVCEE